MGSSVSPELSFVAACCIWPPSKARSNAICDAAAKPLDWDHVLHITRRHHVVGLVHDGIVKARLSVPEHIITTIASQAAELVRRSLKLAAEARRLQSMFAEVHLPIAFLKGVSLSILGLWRSWHPLRSRS